MRLGFTVCDVPLSTHWSCISGLIRGGGKDLSQGVNKPVRVELSRLSG